MRVLISPDKFRGTLSARAAAAAIAAGWRLARPHDHVEEAPLADGGEGTLDLLLETLGGVRRTELIAGPMGDPIEADFGIISSDGEPRAVVEASRASGLQLLARGGRNVARATTRGMGQLIRAASRISSNILVCLGGSATNDGGAGMGQAIGVRLLDADGRDLPPGGAALMDLASISLSRLDPAVRRASVIGACDVENPLTGPKGASAMYGPQKGASPDDVLLLDRALARFAEVIRRDIGIDVRDVAGAGAAGGSGAGLVAFAGAHLRPGAELVMDCVGFDARLFQCDLVITGEGTFDAGSLWGKVPAAVLRHARRAGKQTLVLCGRSELTSGDVRVESLVDRFGEERAMGDPASALSSLTAAVAANLP